MHISIEGFDGVGKTTVSKLLSKNTGFLFVEKPLKYIFDPNGGEAEYLRIRDYFNDVSPNNRALSATFYGLGNIYLYEKFKNINIITDRHLLSNYAWSYGEEAFEIFDTLYNILDAPTLTIILYCNPKTITERLKNRSLEDSDLKKVVKSEIIYDRMEFFAQRHKMDYEKIDTSKKSPNEIVDLILGFLKTRGIIDE